MAWKDDIMRQVILALVAGLTIAALPAPALARTETAVLAGGCFWGMEACSSM